MIDHTVCPACRHPKLKTVQTDHMTITDVVLTRRRKRCYACGHLHKTVEIPVELANELFAED